ncbi:MAG: hypothetical protein ACR2O6_10380 [Ilumatobacteraceae bacterium]
MASTEDSVTLHSSWWGIVGSYAGALILLAIGLTAVIGGGWRPFSIVVFTLGALVTFGVAVDFPFASTFSADGVRRHTLLRRQFLPWAKVSQLTRSRAGLLRGLRKVVLGGLVAVVGRRRYLLVDQQESGAEYDALFDVIFELDDDIGLDTLGRPADDVVPTWIYRRSKWAPEHAKRR